MPKLNDPAKVATPRQVPWMEKKLEFIFRYTDEDTGACYSKTRNVLCRCWGGVAVYRSEDDADRDQDRWYVVAERCRLVITKLHGEADALRVAQTLAERFCLAWQEDTREAVVEALPKWVGAWCVAMRQGGIWLNPEPYQKKGK